MDKPRIYERTETVRHPESLQERVIARQRFAADELALEHVDQSPEAYSRIERDAEGVPVVIELQAQAWDRDYTQTLQVAYTLVTE